MAVVKQYNPIEKFALRVTDYAGDRIASMVSVCHEKDLWTFECGEVAGHPGHAGAIDMYRDKVRLLSVR
jgi:hypothetical protein